MQTHQACGARALHSTWRCAVAPAARPATAVNRRAILHQSVLHNQNLRTRLRLAQIVAARAISCTVSWPRWARCRRADCSGLQHDWLRPKSREHHQIGEQSHLETNNPSTNFLRSKAKAKAIQDLWASPPPCSEASPNSTRRSPTVERFHGRASTRPRHRHFELHTIMETTDSGKCAYHAILVAADRE